MARSETDQNKELKKVHKLNVLYQAKDLPQTSAGDSLREGKHVAVDKIEHGNSFHGSNKPSTRTMSGTTGAETSGATVKGFFKTVNDLTPSLEAIAHLSQEEQVALMQRILNQLHTQATDITNENANMERSIQVLEEQIASVRKGLSGVAYGDFIFENTILNERLKRIMNPACNKNIQCGINDDENTKECQTLNLNEVLLNYAEEIKKMRELQEENDTTIQARKWEEIHDDDVEGPVDYTVINRIKIVLILVMLLACILFVSHIVLINIHYFI